MFPLIFLAAAARFAMTVAAASACLAVAFLSLIASDLSAAFCAAIAAMRARSSASFEALSEGEGVSVAFPFDRLMAAASEYIAHAAAHDTHLENNTLTKAHTALEATPGCGSPGGKRFGGMRKK